MKKLLKKGFTLLELLIVIVILGLLTSLVSFSLLSILGSASAEAAKIDIGKINQGVSMYKLKAGMKLSLDNLIITIARNGQTLEFDFIKLLVKVLFDTSHIHRLQSQEKYFQYHHHSILYKYYLPSQQ